MQNLLFRSRLEVPYKHESTIYDLYAHRHTLCNTDSLRRSRDTRNNFTNGTRKSLGKDDKRNSEEEMEIILAEIIVPRSNIIEILARLDITF